MFLGMDIYSWIAAIVIALIVTFLPITLPFKPDRSGFMEVNPGIASSYIFSLKPGDKVILLAEDLWFITARKKMICMSVLLQLKR